MERITFDELCDMEPELDALYRMTSSIGRCRGKYLCANRLWIEIFKPILRRLVGWNRVAKQKQMNEEKPFARSAAEIINSPIPPRIKFAENIIIPNMASTCEDARLWSSEAYDVAYESIYNALNGRRLRR